MIRIRLYNKHIIIRLTHTIIYVLALLLPHSCANIGNPTGGPIDEAPPKFIKSIPSMGELNAKNKRISIEFDEFIKLEKASEKVVVSPPQVQAAEIKTVGKRLVINLQDSLQANSTYTVDFADAIVDNNEGNPLGNFTFTFSTGAVIDTMEIAGTLLEASNLEPVKGMLVGLHNNLADSAFTKLPLNRVARTNGRGQFSIRGVAPGTYRVYGLQDMNQNFRFDQKSEAIAFYDSLVIPRFEQRTRRDTIWADTLTVDTIIEKQYTHYLPDHLLLRSFKEKIKQQYLVKNERLTKQKFSLYFAAPADSLPLLEGLNFDNKEAFLIEKSVTNDTIHYWIRDSLVYNIDTLGVKVSYLYTDTLNQLLMRNDTLHLATKHTKNVAKTKKKNDEPEPTVFLKANLFAPTSFDVYNNIRLEFEEPILRFDTAAIQLKQKVDTLWVDTPFLFEQDSLHPRFYEMLAEWEPEKEYQFTVDSTAFHGFYGLFTDKIKQAFKVRSLDDYSVINLNIIGADSVAIVELLDTQDKVIRSTSVVNKQADFNFLNPGKYYLRLFNDSNQNGKWDTGNYEQKLQPEMVFYYPHVLETKVKWSVEQDWDLSATPGDRQKPDELKKQKPDENKKKKQNSKSNNSNRDSQRR